MIDLIKFFKPQQKYKEDAFYQKLMWRFCDFFICFDQNEFNNCKVCFLIQWNNRKESVLFYFITFHMISCWFKQLKIIEEGKNLYLKYHHSVIFFSYICMLDFLKVCYFIERNNRLKVLWFWASLTEKRGMFFYFLIPSFSWMPSW